MASDPYSRTEKLIAPSILSADFSQLDREIADVMRHGADFLHLDVMDGHFVPNISFGPHVTAGARKAAGAEVYLDAHLMVSDPLKYAGPMVRAGANGITFHVEAVADPVQAARDIRNLGCHVGITLRPATPIETLFAALEWVDLVLIMSVNPGFSGQSFMPEMLDKVSAIRPRLRNGQKIEIDGGMNQQTIGQAARAGVDWFVLGSAIFDSPDRAGAIRAIRTALGPA